MAGIGAAMHDFAKDDDRHQGPVREDLTIRLPGNAFLPGGAVAILPLNGLEASVVQTFPPEEAARQMGLDIQDFLDTASRRLEHRFGRITSLSERFAYPLVGVYANQFVRPGFAVVGDAAVGMHPVTAHGYNLGVQGQAILADKIRGALARGRGPADPRALSAYERDHRRLSAGMYWSTVAIAELYSRESLPAKLARRALFDAGRLLPTARRAVVKALTQPLPAH